MAEKIYQGNLMVFNYHLAMETVNLFLLRLFVIECRFEKICGIRIKHILKIK